MNTFKSFFQALRAHKPKATGPKLSAEEAKSICVGRANLFLEDPTYAYEILLDLPRTYAVAGIDGSRCTVDHHEGSAFSVLLTATCQITYGVQSGYTHSLYPAFYADQQGYNTDLWLRTKQLEREYAHAVECIAAHAADYPLLVLLDGSIIEHQPFVCSQTHQACMATYTSAPRHASVARGICDVDLFAPFIKPWSRTAWFCEREYCVCYVANGYEMARIEMARVDEASRALCIAVIALQCRKGGGYPLILSYAHHHSSAIAYFKKIGRLATACKPSYKYMSKGYV